MSTTRSTTEFTTQSTTEAKAPVTVLGLGAMGSALAGAFLAAGHPTTVWNRSPGRADDLVARGAVLAADAEAAVRAGEVVVVCVVDYAASQAILDPLADALAGRVLVNLTSDTPERARTAAAWAAGHSIAYLDGAVMVPTPAVGTPEALLFYAGSRASFEAYESTLKALGGRAAFVGEDHGLAALYDLSLLDFFYGSITGLIHAFALGAADKVPASALVPYMQTIVDILPPLAQGWAEAVDAGEYPGHAANLGMMTEGVAHILHASRERGLDVSHLEAVKSVADRAIARGHAADDWASIVEVVRNGS